MPKTSKPPLWRRPCCERWRVNFRLGSTGGFGGGPANPVVALNRRAVVLAEGLLTEALLMHAHGAPDRRP
jgi:hypothetical protein